MQLINALDVDVVAWLERFERLDACRRREPFGAVKQTRLCLLGSGRLRITESKTLASWFAARRQDRTLASKSTTNFPGIRSDPCN